MCVCYFVVVFLLTLHPTINFIVKVWFFFKIFLFKIFAEQIFWFIWWTPAIRNRLKISFIRSEMTMFWLSCHVFSSIQKNTIKLIYEYQPDQFNVASVWMWYDGGDWYWWRQASKVTIKSGYLQNYKISQND